MWHEARRSERKVHDLMDAARKRAQRRALFLAKRRGDPQQSLQIVGSRCRVYRDDGLYQAAQDQQGLIPWNGKQDILIDRFDGRALLDFIRDSSSRPFRVQEKTEEEEELEEFVNFERYRDLIKHRRRGFTDEEGLQHVHQELEAKTAVPFALERPHSLQAPASKGSYSQVGFSYKGDGNEESHHLDSDDEDEDDEDDDDEKDFSSDDSNDEGMEKIAKEFGVKRYNWLVYMDKKAKEEEKRQKEVIKGDPAIRKLSRKERRKASQMEREREREAARSIGRAPHHDPYREPRRSPTYEAYPRSRMSRSRSQSYSPSHSRRHDRSSHADNGHRSKPKPPKIEYITEFGGSTDMDDQKVEGISPPSSPLQADLLNRSSGSQILEALHVDPASALSLEREKSTRMSKPSVSASTSSSAIAKLSKTATGGPLKTQLGEKKETPQERLKRIMSKQLNKQIRKDTAAEMAKKREQERQRQEKLAETSRISRYRYRSRSRSRSCSPPRRQHGRSCSRSRSRSRSRSPRRYYSRSRSRSFSRSRSPRLRSRSRH
ncbi:CLK4-associating serine/arginine rich protein isoform X2 [Phoenix dactylifera]|uniref:CLK4-associating serine/arginine rich protein isoform X2 n=1 Tax=Phoenix dactylifera TaxID=42345 RepID=A0A8B7CS42_PHODC|nr:CLK4-associating serine/arginine rich protein isoform X2 [Phoenix dactylifera]